LHPPFAQEYAATDVTQVATHVPAEQQPPLQAWVAEHDVVHVLVELQAWPEGQSLAVVQWLPQEPPAQVLPPVQACEPPQPPQFASSVWKSTQAPPQAPNPAAHANPHVLDAQEGTALATDVVQACPHEPQLRGSFVGSTHAPPHATCGCAHVDAHV
jgi:hypothetical protein